VVSHSSAHALCPSARNLTDRQLDAIAESDGLIGLSFFRNDLRGDGRLEPDTPMEAIVQQMRYLADRIGVEHVAFGSDFDGATVPKDLGDVSGLPKLINALRDAGFDENALAKICRENWLRILGHAWNESPRSSG
jgi:membrane dipeptidase